MRYVHRDEDAEYVAALKFDARRFKEIHDLKLPPPPTRVRLRVRRRGTLFAKTNQLGDISVPSAPWFNTRIMALMDGTLFVGVDNGLLLVDPATATIRKRFRTGTTQVSQIVPDHDRRRVYVVNEAYDFAAEAGASNVAAFEHDGTLSWRAPTVTEPWANDSGLYTQIMAVDRAILEVTTWTGRCQLDAEDGRVVASWFTKGS